MEEGVWVDKKWLPCTFWCVLILLTPVSITLIYVDDTFKFLLCHLEQSDTIDS